jgi:hypothetical protein
MNEIELLRHDYAAIPEPDSRSVARARDSLLRTQAPLARSRPRRPRLFLAFALAIAATTVIALEHPFGNSGVDLARADPAAAGFRALSAKTGVWHYRAALSAT